MNYQAHYDRIISRAKSRELDGYVEAHHVLPKCMGGPDTPENIVALTAEEHFVAHQLLHKIYPHNKSLAYALVVMLGNPYGHRNNKLYGWIRRNHAANVSVQSKARWQDPAYREKHRAAMDEVRKRPGYREMFSRIQKGRIKSDQERANISAARRLVPPRKFSDEARANMAAARRRTWAERKARGEGNLIAKKIVATRRKNGSYDFTPEHRAAIGAASKRAHELRAGRLR